MSPLLAHATHDRQSETHSVPARKPGARSLRIGAQNDNFEREADRMANEVMQGGKLSNWSFGKVQSGHVQRQPVPEPSTNQPAAAPQPNNYKEGAEKLGEAFLKTDLGKKIEQAATDDPLVKGASDFFGTLPGKIIAGAAAAGAVSALAATHKALPAQIPEIPLDKIRPGLKVKLTYEGPVDHPTKAMVMFSYTPQGEKKKPKETASESYRAETARMAADMDKFRAEMTYAPGSPQAQQQEADQKATDDWMTQRFGSLPGTGGRPLGPGAGQPSAGGPQQSEPQWSFSPLAHPELDKKLELQPLTTGSGATLQRKCACQGGGAAGECEECREGKTLQRQAAGPAESDLAPAIVDQVLTSPGRPLDKATRDYFEPRLGYDLSRIRVHADAQAAESARSVNALAYTVGDRIAFAAGHYSPQSSEGRRLLAHELAHTIQQSRGLVQSPHGDGLKVGKPGDSFEQQADAAASEIVKNSVMGAPPPAAAMKPTPATTLQRAPDPYAKYSIPELRKLAVTDRAAAEALRARYHAMSNTDLERYARNDPAAQAEYSQRTVTPRASQGQGPFSNREIREALENDIRTQRASSGIARREPSAVDPEVDPEGGTIGSARTDIPGLESRSFLGRSPRAGGQVNPASNFPPATDPAVLPHTHGHAEQGIADELEAALRDIPREQLKGKTVWMLIEQEPCSTCAQGVANAKVDPGVLKKLALEFPEVTFEIKNLRTSSILVLKGATSSGSLGAAGENAPAAKGAAEKPVTDSVQVKTDIEVKNVVKNPDGSTVSDLEYNLGENLAQLNQGAPEGGALPARMSIRVTTSPEGAIISVESLSGEPAALVEALARQTLTEGAATGGAVAGASRLAAVSKGLKFGGWIAFVAITGYQLFKATPAQRPRVLAQAAGGLAGGVATGFAVCNLALDFETAGWGVLICGLIAGGAGGVAGSAGAGAIYDEATATEMDFWLKEVDRREENERVLFNILVGSLGDAASCIKPAFVMNFLSIVPIKMKDYEVVLVAGRVAHAPGPPSKPRPLKSKDSPFSSANLGSQQTPQVAKPKSKPCPNCHDQNPPSPPRNRLDFNQEEFDEIMAAPSCDEVINAKLNALKAAIAQLPEAPPPLPKKLPKRLFNSTQAGSGAAGAGGFPSVQQQRGKDVCPNCHAEVQHQFDKSLLEGPGMTDEDLVKFEAAAQQPQKGTATAQPGTHATPADVHFSPSPQGFPSVEEQQGRPCPNCHTSSHDTGFPSYGQGSDPFGASRSKQVSDENRKLLQDWISAQQK
jgi:hypothetical protein